MKFKKYIGYFLISFLVISNVFNYSSYASYMTEFNIITETIMAGNEDVKYGEITISHLDIDTGENLLPDELISAVLNEEIFSENYKKDIKGYKFSMAEPEKFIVAEDNEIKLYYKKDDEIPEEEYVDVTIHHYLIDSTQQVADDSILKDIKVGALISSKDYIKEIENYEFAAAVPEALTVAKDATEISLYYKKVEAPKPLEIDVQVYYYDLNDKEISAANTIKSVKLGEKLKGRDYVKPIEGYDFKHAFPEILEVREDNHVIKLYYKEKQVVPPVEFVNVTVNHFLIDTDTKIADSDILEKVKVGKILKCDHYIKDIEGYIYHKVQFETLQVGENNNVINIYYKKVEDPEKPTPPDPEGGNNSGGGNGESSLPQTGMRDYLWLAYVLILLGMILRIHKKAEKLS